MPHEFLSDEWFDAVQALDAPPPPAAMNGVAINLVVTRDGAENIEAHMAEGSLQRGLAENAQTTITAPYEVAKSVFVKRDQQASMQAFMSGQIKVAGDMTKLMAMGQQQPTPEQQAYGDAVLALTDV
jgi:putative sterol carrier protein